MRRKDHYHHVIFAGTFDHLHSGHTYLIDQAFRYGDLVSVGVTSDAFVTQKKFSRSLETYMLRLKNVKEYVNSKNNLSRSAFFKINDIYGPAATDADMDAILVTRHTRSNAVRINILRKKNHLEPLKIIQVPLKRGDDNRTISSTKIRQGTINRSGSAYHKLYDRSPKLFLPASLRQELRRPAGLVFTGEQSDLPKAALRIKHFIRKDKPVMVIAIGDIVSSSLMSVGYTPDLSVIDLKTQRHKLPTRISSEVATHINSPGTLSRRASEALRTIMSNAYGSGKSQIVRIIGEEDLMTVSAILNAPLGAIVIYGQQDIGAVIVKVTEERKSYVASLLNRFKASR